MAVDRAVMAFDIFEKMLEVTSTLLTSSIEVRQCLCSFSCWRMCFSWLAWQKEPPPVAFLPGRWVGAIDTPFSTPPPFFFFPTVFPLARSAQPILEFQLEVAVQDGWDVGIRRKALNFIAGTDHAP